MDDFANAKANQAQEKEEDANEINVEIEDTFESFISLKVLTEDEKKHLLKPNMDQQPKAGANLMGSLIEKEEKKQSEKSEDTESQFNNVVIALQVDKDSEDLSKTKFVIFGFIVLMMGSLLYLAGRFVNDTAYLRKFIKFEREYNDYHQVVSKTPKSSTTLPSRMDEDDDENVHEPLNNINNISINPDDIGFSIIKFERENEGEE